MTAYRRFSGTGGAFAERLRGLEVSRREGRARGEGRSERGTKPAPSAPPDRYFVVLAEKSLNETPAPRVRRLTETPEPKPKKVR